MGGILFVALGSKHRICQCQYDTSMSFFPSAKTKIIWEWQALEPACLDSGDQGRDDYGTGNFVGLWSCWIDRVNAVRKLLHIEIDRTQ